MRHAFLGLLADFSEDKTMSKTDNLLMLAASLLLLAVNWFAFHDFREAHAVRDWLMLFASVLVFIQFTRQFWNRNVVE